MRPLAVSFFISVLAGGAEMFAQTSTDTAMSKPISGVTTPEIRPFGYFDWSSKPSSSLPRNLTVESFGYGSGPQALGFEFSPAYTSALYNIQGLECPRCLIGPQPNRTRFTLPPFGARTTLKLLDGRAELFSGVGGLQAFKPDGTFEPYGGRNWTSNFGDAWLSQVEGGGRVAVDGKRRIWLGTTGRYLYNFGSGKRQWGTFLGNATFLFGR